MRILAINQFYAPDHSATSQLLTDLCESLAAAGDDVSVIASRGRYLGGAGLPPSETIRGVHVSRPWATGFGKGSLAHRAADYASFWTSAVIDALRSQRPDVVLALTTPPMIAAGAAFAAKVRGVKMVAWVQDVYPEVAAAFGVLSETSPSYRGFYQLARLTHRMTDRMVVLSDGMAERLVAQGADAARIRVVPNWADSAQIRPLVHRENPFRLQHGLTDRFVALYSGNLGVGHEFETFAAAARLVERQRPDVLFLFIGEGGRKKEAERLCAGLENVRFLPYQPRDRLSESLSAADVHLISLRHGLDGLLVPSKLYGALASGRPVYYVGPTTCEVAKVVREFDLGWTGTAGDSEQLASALVSAFDERRKTEQRGEMARHVFEQHFDRPRAVARFREVLSELG